MTKAKQFIQNYKRDYSNVNVGWNDNGEEITWCSPWLSPDDALRAVEIEREEMIERACEYWYKYNRDVVSGFTVNVENFRKYMEDKK